MKNNHYQTATSSYEPELFEEETAYLSKTEMAAPDLHMMKGGDLSERQQEVVDEAAVHVTAENVHLVKDITAFDNSMYLNEHMEEQCVNRMLRSVYTMSRVAGTACEGEVMAFSRQRRKRLMQIADKIEERGAMKQLNEAGRSVYPKQKKDESKLNLIFRLFSSDRTKITQAKDQDGELPMMTGSFFGTGID